MPTNTLQNLNNKIKRIALLYGGSSTEREVSLKTGLMITKNLNPDKFSVKLIDTGKKGWQKYLILNLSKFDLAFIALHGKNGEDGVIQGFLESIGLPYTGSGVLASSLGMDKLRSHLIFKSLKIFTPNYLPMTKNDFQKNKASLIKDIKQTVGLPCVVKPNCGGSSVGVDLIISEKEIERKLEKAFLLEDCIIVEKYLRGTELTAGILGNFDEPETLISLPLIEIIPGPQCDFFNYEAKYVKGTAEEITPARIDSRLTKRIQELALKAYKAFNCRGFARLDLILVEKIPYFLEVNTIPGLTDNSLLPKAAKAYGLSFPRLIETIINLVRTNSGK